jgi:hypothetical protein
MPRVKLTWHGRRKLTYRSLIFGVSMLTAAVNAPAVLLGYYWLAMGLGLTTILAFVALHVIWLTSLDKLEDVKRK